MKRRSWKKKLLPTHTTESGWWESVSQTSNTCYLYTRTICLTASPLDCKREVDQYISIRRKVEQLAGARKSCCSQYYEAFKTNYKSTTNDFAKSPKDVKKLINNAIIIKWSYFETEIFEANFIVNAFKFINEKRNLLSTSIQWNQTKKSNLQNKNLSCGCSKFLPWFSPT